MFKIKLELAKYILRKVVASGCEVISEEEKSGEYSSFMRILYFLCLESYKSDTLGLFEIINNWYAYPRGYVEVDIYNRLIYNLFDLAPVDIDSKYLDIVNGCVDSLISFGILYKSRNELIDITHEFPLWNETYNYSDSRKVNIDSFNLSKDYKFYNDIKYDTRKDKNYSDRLVYQNGK